MRLLKPAHQFFFEQLRALLDGIFNKEPEGALPGSGGGELMAEQPSK